MLAPGYFKVSRGSSHHRLSFGPQLWEICARLKNVHRNRGSNSLRMRAQISWIEKHDIPPPRFLWSYIPQRGVPSTWWSFAIVWCRCTYAHHNNHNTETSHPAHDGTYFERSRQSIVPKNERPHWPFTHEKYSPVAKHRKPCPKSVCFAIRCGWCYVWHTDMFGMKVERLVAQTSRFIIS